ncbi:hypothetical protein AB0K89_16700 [Streptomyces cinnamoneus]|uniref:hypothetical protein n=1 Tax=Streptomyces cinnamoneus TaxID=53446 RepID=UPI003448B77B
MPATPARTQVEHGPGSALARLHAEVQALHEAAGRPSLRELADDVRAIPEEDRDASASHTTIGEVIKCSRLTQLKTFRLVIRCLLRRRTGGDEGEPTAEDAWPRFEALWHAADQERPRAALPPHVRGFTADMRRKVFGPLGGDVHVISRRLDELLPALRTDVLTPAALRAVVSGARLPHQHELEGLLELLARDGRALAPEERRLLMQSYYDALRAREPEWYEACMLRERCDAERDFRTVVERKLHLLEQRHGNDTAAEYARKMQAVTERAADEAALAHQRHEVQVHFIRWLEGELSKERHDKRLAQDAERAVRAALATQERRSEELAGKLSATEELVLDMRSQRDESLRRLAEQATLHEAAAAVAGAAVAYDAEHLRPPTGPALPVRGWGGYDTSAWDTTAYDVNDPYGHWHKSSYGSYEYDPYAGADLLLLTAPDMTTTASDTASYTVYDTASEADGWPAGSLPSWPRHEETCRQPAPAPPSDSPPPAQAPAPRGLFRFLHALFRNGRGRHARRR